MKFKNIIEAVDASEDPKVIKEFKKLLDKAFNYGYENLESSWSRNTVLDSLDEVIDYADKLKSK